MNPLCLSCRRPSQTLYCKICRSFSPLRWKKILLPNRSLFNLTDTIRMVHPTDRLRGVDLTPAVFHFIVDMYTSIYATYASDLTIDSIDDPNSVLFKSALNYISQSVSLRFGIEFSRRG